MFIPGKFRFRTNFCTNLMQLSKFSRNIVCYRSLLSSIGEIFLQVFLLLQFHNFKNIQNQQVMLNSQSYLMLNIIIQRQEKIIKLNTAKVDKSRIHDQTIIMKQSTWVITRRPLFIPLNIINSQN